MMRGIGQRAPAIAGSCTVTAMCADNYHARRRWADWLGRSLTGACLIVETEGTTVTQRLHFEHFADALNFRLAFDGNLAPMVRDACWTDIEKAGRRYSPCVYVAGWPIYERA